MILRILGPKTIGLRVRPKLIGLRVQSKMILRILWAEADRAEGSTEDDGLLQPAQDGEQAEGDGARARRGSRVQLAEVA
jgi:hypothetical protein